MDFHFQSVTFSSSCLVWKQTMHTDSTDLIRYASHLPGASGQASSPSTHLLCSLAYTHRMFTPLPLPTLS